MLTTSEGLTELEYSVNPVISATSIGTILRHSLRFLILVEFEKNLSRILYFVFYNFFIIIKVLLLFRNCFFFTILILHDLVINKATK